MRKLGTRFVLAISLFTMAQRAYGKTASDELDKVLSSKSAKFSKTAEVRLWFTNSFGNYEADSAYWLPLIESLGPSSNPIILLELKSAVERSLPVCKFKPGFHGFLEAAGAFAINLKSKESGNFSQLLSSLLKSEECTHSKYDKFLKSVADTKWITEDLRKALLLRIVARAAKYSIENDPREHFFAISEVIRTLESFGQFNNADVLASRMVKIYPASERSAFAKARSARQLFAYKEAEIFRKKMKDPEWKSSLEFELGMQAFQQRQWATAILHFENALASAPVENQAKTIRIRKALAHLFNGDGAKAADDLASAREKVGEGFDPVSSLLVAEGLLAATQKNKTGVDKALKEIERLATISFSESLVLARRKELLARVLQDKRRETLDKKNQDLSIFENFLASIVFAN